MNCKIFIVHNFVMKANTHWRNKIRIIHECVCVRACFYLQSTVCVFVCGCVCLCM